MPQPEGPQGARCRWIECDRNGRAVTSVIRTLAETNPIKKPKEAPLGERTSLGPKATAPITVTCQSPDLGSVEQNYSGAILGTRHLNGR